LKRLGQLIIVAALAISPPIARSQEKAFDVVSIKRNRTAAEASDTNTTPGRLSLVNVTPLSLIRRAFGVQDAQIIDAPGWLSSERYDVVAVTGNAATLSDKERQPFLQDLLADRWQFRFHREMREIRVYSLVRLQNGPTPTSHTGPGEYSMRIEPTADGRLALRSIRGNMMRFAEILTRQIGDLVVDGTGLSGEYDFNLQWEPDQNAGATGPSLFAALQEQLGLKLESAKRSVPAIVIDHIERPTEN
jgi:uncharacterized protein (TIGR03435 family)